MQETLGEGEFGKVVLASLNNLRGKPGILYFVFWVNLDFLGILYLYLCLYLYLFLYFAAGHSQKVLKLFHWQNLAFMYRNWSIDLNFF